MAGPSLHEVGKELGDLLYVVLGTAEHYGLNMKPIIQEIHRSNMTKQGGYKREDGKWIKPDTYSKADLTACLLHEAPVSMTPSFFSRFMSTISRYGLILTVIYIIAIFGLILTIDTLLIRVQISSFKEGQEGYISPQNIQFQESITSSRLKSNTIVSRIQYDNYILPFQIRNDSIHIKESDMRKYVTGRTLQIVPQESTPLPLQSHQFTETDLILKKESRP